MLWWKCLTSAMDVWCGWGMVSFQGSLEIKKGQHWKFAAVLQLSLEYICIPVGLLEGIHVAGVFAESQCPVGKVWISCATAGKSAQLYGIICLDWNTDYSWRLCSLLTYKWLKLRWFYLKLKVQLNSCLPSCLWAGASDFVLQQIRSDCCVCVYSSYSLGFLAAFRCWNSLF